MAAYTVNYDDERFKNLEVEKQNELNSANQRYDDLINERNNLTQQQSDMIDRWETTQKDIADKNLQYQKDLVEQQRQKAEADYQKEAKASYIDYQKEADRYGVSRESVVNNGLSNSGYAETSKVDMYNTYQNRLASARSSIKDANLEFDNAIRQAQLNNDTVLAENALKALQDKLNIALEGFNYKSAQEENRANWSYNINNNYYDRYKDVESQINYENETAEKIRQYNEQMAYQKERDKIADQQWEEEYKLQQSRTNSNLGGSGNDSTEELDEDTGTTSSSTKPLTSDGGYSLNGAIEYLYSKGVIDNHVPNVQDLIVKGYLTTKTINRTVYYYPNTNPSTTKTSNNKSSSSQKEPEKKQTFWEKLGEALRHMS